MLRLRRFLPALQKLHIAATPLSLPEHTSIKTFSKFHSHTKPSSSLFSTTAVLMIATKTLEEKVSNKIDPFFERLIEVLPKDVLAIPLNANLTLHECMLLSEINAVYKNQVRSFIMEMMLKEVNAKIFYELAPVFLTNQTDLNYAIIYIAELKNRFGEAGLSKQLCWNEKGKNHNSPLELAIIHGCDRIVNLLIKNGAVIPDYTLGWAVAFGANKETIKALIDGGADPSLVKDYEIYPSDHPDRHQLEKRSDIIKQLLNQGLPPSALWNGLNYAYQYASYAASVIFSDEEIINKMLPSVKEVMNFTNDGVIANTIYMIGSSRSAKYPLSLSSVEAFLKTVKGLGYEFNNLQDYYALRNAANHGLKDLVKVFIKNGIDPISFDFENLQHYPEQRKGYHVILQALEEVRQEEERAEVTTTLRPKR